MQFACIRENVEVIFVGVPNIAWADMQSQSIKHLSKFKLLAWMNVYAFKIGITKNKYNIFMHTIYNMQSKSKQTKGKVENVYVHG